MAIGRIGEIPGYSLNVSVSIGLSPEVTACEGVGQPWREAWRENTEIQARSMSSPTWASWTWGGFSRVKETGLLRARSQKIIETEWRQWYLRNSAFPNRLFRCFPRPSTRGNGGHCQCCLHPEIQNPVQWKHCHLASESTFVFVSICGWLNLDSKENQT